MSETPLLTSGQGASRVTQSAPDGSGSGPHPFAIGLTLFAGVVLITVGVFQFFQGLAAVIRQDFYVVAPNNIYELNVSGWGWIHLALGVLLVVTGFFLLTGRLWARVVGIALAALSAVANFLFLPHYPIWALIIIALDVAVIWALASNRGERA